MVLYGKDKELSYEEGLKAFEEVQRRVRDFFLLYQSKTKISLMKFGALIGADGLRDFNRFERMFYGENIFDFYTLMHCAFLFEKDLRDFFPESVHKIEHHGSTIELGPVFDEELFYQFKLYQHKKDPELIVICTAKLDNPKTFAGQIISNPNIRPHGWFERFYKSDFKPYHGKIIHDEV